MEFIYVAQGKNGLLKIGMSKNVQKRSIALRGEFKERGDELVRIEACEPIDHALGTEYVLQTRLAKSFERHSGREWFVNGDFEAALAIAHEQCNKTRAEQDYLKTPAGIKEQARREKRWEKWRAENDAMTAKHSAWCAEQQILRERRRTEKLRRRHGPMEFVVSHLLGNKV